MPACARDSLALCAFGVSVGLLLLLARRRRPPRPPAPPQLDTGKEQEGHAPRRLRKAETVLRRRTSRLIVVLEGSYDLHNQAAVCRTADSLGVQHVWLVASPTSAAADDTPPPRRHRPTRRARREAELRALSLAQMREACAAPPHSAPPPPPPPPPPLSRKITRHSAEWLSLRHFDSAAACVRALREASAVVWVTVLAQHAAPLDAPALRVPPPPARLAIVFGCESVGVSAEMAAAADRCVYFPLHGFSESLNLSVSAALILQGVFQKDPSLRGAMSEEERAALRRDWFLRLAKSPEQCKTYPAWALGTPPEPFDDLRRTDEMRGTEDKRIPPKIRRKLGERFVKPF
ncbi:hypothetical protein AB1Y20_007809 [Prymnesium parvum]|uniref:tRNA/rRNA methyltransferase SpoU type domain-containing protein n=1 Tax=Prymnesium parvum TaxID=97485 RepID=A0AB34IVZ9_PRYPA